jgi:hypothetical protein
VTVLKFIGSLHRQRGIALSRRLITRALTGLTATVALLGGVVAVAGPAQANTQAEEDAGHGVLATLPSVNSVANYQDRTGTHVVHAGTNDGKITNANTPGGEDTKYPRAPGQSRATQSGDLPMRAHTRGGSPVICG